MCCRGRGEIEDTSFRCSIPYSNTWQSILTICLGLQWCGGSPRWLVTLPLQSGVGQRQTGRASMCFLPILGPRHWNNSPYSRWSSYFCWTFLETLTDMPRGFPLIYLSKSLKLVRLAMADTHLRELELHFSLHNRVLFAGSLLIKT